MALIRCPAVRWQIGIMAERIFDKQILAKQSKLIIQITTQSEYIKNARHHFIGNDCWSITSSSSWQYSILTVSHNHLEMVHDLNADERTGYLKRTILSVPTPSIQARLPNTIVKLKLKYIRQDRRVVQHSYKSSDKTPTVYVLPEPYPKFRFRHTFSLMIVWSCMSWKNYFFKQLLEINHIEYENHRKSPKIHWFYGDSLTICLKTWRGP